MGAKLNAASSAGDPWGTAVPGAYADGTAGFILGNIDTPVSGSASINTRATDGAVNVGIETTGTYLDTREADGSLWVITHVGNTIDIELEFSVGALGIPTGVTFYANLQSDNDSLAVQAWNWSLSAWGQVGILPGTKKTTLDPYGFPLFSRHVGTGSDAGAVRIRLVGGSSSPRLDIDLAYVSYAIVDRSVQFVGTAAAGDTSSITFPASASAATDYYRPGMVLLTAGTGAGQSRRIESYDGDTKIATVATAWSVVPDATTEFSGPAVGFRAGQRR